MELHLTAIVLRVLIAYFYLLAIVRVSGKRSVSQAAPVDFVIALVIGDMIDDLLWGEVPAAQFVVGVGSLVLLEAAVAFVSARSARVYLLAEGGFPVLIEDGEVDPRAMRREELGEADLDHLLRARSVDPAEIESVHLGVLEQDGHLSVLKTPRETEATRDDVKTLERKRRRKQR